MTSEKTEAKRQAEFKAALNKLATVTHACLLDGHPDSGANGTIGVMSDVKPHTPVMPDGVGADIPAAQIEADITIIGRTPDATIAMTRMMLEASGDKENPMTVEMGSNRNMRVKLDKAKLPAVTKRMNALSDLIEHDDGTRTKVKGMAVLAARAKRRSGMRLNISAMFDEHELNPYIEVHTNDPHTAHHLTQGGFTHLQWDATKPWICAKGEGQVGGHRLGACGADKVGHALEAVKGISVDKVQTVQPTGMQRHK